MPFVWMNNTPHVQSVGPNGLKYTDGTSSKLSLNGQFSSGGSGNTPSDGNTVVESDIVVLEITRELLVNGEVV